MQRVPEVKTGSESAWLQRAHGVKVVSGPMNGLTLGMWLQRQVNASKKKRSSRYATTAQYKEKTSLFSWILNAKQPTRRAVTVALLVAGVASSPITACLHYFNFNMTSTSDDVTDTESSWMDGWRSVPVLRRLVSTWKRLVRDADWHRHVWLHALTTTLDLYDPTHSSAFERGLLYQSDEVVLVQQGIAVVEREVARARRALVKQEQDMTRFAGDLLWFPFRDKCYSLKQGNFKFCPFQVCTLTPLSPLLR